MTYTVSLTSFRDLVSLTENLDTTSTIGRAMLGVMAVFAQLTGETIDENVKQGLRQRAKKGKWAEGSPPFGYDLNKDTGFLQLNEEEVKVVRQIFRTYIFGHEEAGPKAQRARTANHKR